MCQKQKDEEYAAYLAEPNSGALLCQSVNCLDSHKATQIDRARMFFCSFSLFLTRQHICTLVLSHIHSLVCSNQPQRGVDDKDRQSHVEYWKFQSWCRDKTPEFVIRFIAPAHVR